MLNKFSYFILFILSFSLTACSPKPQQENQYLEHPQILKEAVVECQKQTDQPQCQIVAKAADKLRSRLLFLMANPEIYGERILKLQMLNAQLKEQLSQGTNVAPEKMAQLKKQLEDSESLVRQYIAVIRLVGIQA